MNDHKLQLISCAKDSYRNLARRGIARSKHKWLMGVAEGVTRIARNIVSSVRPRSPLGGMDAL